MLLNFIALNTMYLGPKATYSYLFGIVISNNINKLTFVADQLKQESPVHRQKRHAAVVTDDKEAAALAAITEAEKFEAEMSTETHNRRKRSAAFFLHAAMKLCEGHPTICRSVELSDHGIKVSIKISDE